MFEIGDTTAGEVSGFKHIETFIDESDGERCEPFALGGDIGSSLLASNAMPDCEALSQRNVRLLMTSA